MVPGILFIVSADRTHLGNSFSAIYGDRLDRDRYMAIFVDNWFRLPDPSSQIFAKYLIERFSLIKDNILTEDDDIYTGRDVFAQLWGEKWLGLFEQSEAVL